MLTGTRIVANTYRDSVALMQLAARHAAVRGVDQVAVVMATAGNLELVRESGMLTKSVSAQPSDILIVARAVTQTLVESTLTQVAAALAVATAGHAMGDPLGGGRAPEMPRCLHAAHRQSPAANLALISVPGEYAAAEARKALALGLNVMLFSDNVTVADEIALKQDASARGLLMMGPDCGTAIIDGIPLGFANNVRVGTIGCIGASGTGLQQVTSLIDRAGLGVSQAIGTGGRDLSDAIGGATLLAALARLAKDRATEVIVLIGKPPGDATAARVLKAAGKIRKPIVINFIGWKPPVTLPANVEVVTTLAGAARVAVALAHGKRASVANAVSAVSAGASTSVRMPKLKFSVKQRYVRGLYSGGTFCYEGSLLLTQALGDVWSNASVNPAFDLVDPWTSRGHSLVDLGDDVFTRGRPHPMIDPRLRNERILEEAGDSTVAAILFDVVLGFGCHTDPAGAMIPTIAAARAKAARSKRPLAFIGFVCGTVSDPQDLARQEAALLDAGVLVAANHAEAASIAAGIVRPLGLRPGAIPRSRRVITKKIAKAVGKKKERK